mgnify:CR=1 FL=1
MRRKRTYQTKRAEQAVREANKILRNFTFGSVGYRKALLEWRNTPRSPSLGSPAQRLMSRKFKGELIETEKNPYPRVIEPETVRKELARTRKHQKQYFD